MELLERNQLLSLNTNRPIWDKTYMVAPLVVVGTKEAAGYDLAPKHMVTLLGDNNYFAFVCTPRHGTYHNIKRTGEFTVSFPMPDQVVEISLSASPRNGKLPKPKAIVASLPTIKAESMDALFIKNSYLYLECELFKIIDGFGDNSIITGCVTNAWVHKDYARVSDQDEQEQLKHHPLLAYIDYGRFAIIRDTFNFPFPKDFKQ